MKNAQRDIFIGNGQAMEEDDGEEAKERRNRFQNERIMISPKKNSDIPDSLENVITSDLGKSKFRGRGRGRSGRGGGGSTRGGRFPPQNQPNFNTRFRAPLFEDQQLQQFRPPLIETRPPIFPSGPPNANNMINPQLIYHQPRFQQFPQQCPPQLPVPHFNEPGLRPVFNQFPQVPRIQNSRMEFRPRPPGPRFNGPLNQPIFLPTQAPHFQAPRPPLHPEGPGRPINHDPIIQNQGSSILGPVPHTLGHPQAALPGPNHPNGPVSAQLPFENRPIFSDQRHFDERRNLYDPRPPYNPGVVNQQFNSISIPQQPTPPVLNVPIQSGHKILINPHFRGTPQPPIEGRPLWENVQQSQSQAPNDSFAQPSGYQDQASYNSSSSNQHNTQKNFPSSKNDDPYSYFSDVWQENKSSKTRSMSPMKNYMDDRDKERERERERDRDNYKDFDTKYKSNNRDNYQEHRDRTPPPRTRDYPSRTRPHNDSYESRSNKSVNFSNRGPPKTLQKRTPEPAERSQREISPKRTKSNDKNLQNRSQKPSSQETNEDDVDPEMREYRKKMEEQKRLRAKILQEKENRRKQAAMEKLDEPKDSKSSDENVKQESKSGIVIGGTKDNTVVTNQLSSRSRNRSTDPPASEGGEKTATTTSNVRIVRTKQLPEKANSVKESLEISSPDEQNKLVQQSNVRRVVISKPLGSVQKVATSIQKTISNLQKQGATVVQNTKVVKPPIQNKSTVASNSVVQSKISAGSERRTVVKDPIGPVRKVLLNKATVAAGKKSVNANSQRIVIPVNSKPNTIIIDNLAASTTENQIRRMCQGIGTVESVEVGEGSATIIFKTHSAAAVFHKKYQRKMIDLSMINVQLVSQINQPINSLTKK